jgi:ferredoxin
MSDIDPYPDNAPGKYYIDLSCIKCGLCPGLAPNVFKESDDATHSLAYAQPETAADLAECEEAIATCPSKSIRDDGEVIAAQA